MSTSSRYGVLATLLFCVAGYLAPEAEALSDTDVRVRLLETASPVEVRITVESGSFTADASGDLRAVRLAAGSIIDIAARNRNLRLEGTLDGLTTTVLRLDPAAPTSVFRVDVVAGNAKTSRSYRGGLVVRPATALDEKGLILVNNVPLEEYVAAVVSSEYGLDDVEGTRAMAVLARTYALKTMAAPGALYDHVDHELSQVYRGVEGLSDAARDAALATAGQVLLYRGALIEAVYHAESGGHTADNETVWDGNPVPYLRGVKDRFANQSPHASWVFVADRRRLLRTLSTLAGGRTVSGFRISSRNADGRVAMVALLTQSDEVSVPANQFRLAVIREFGARSLRSTLFDAARKGGTYRFTGSGFGHGVGLSQWGAHEMARRGYAYDEILAYYFRGTELVRLPDLVASPTVLAARQDDAQPRQIPANVPPGSLVVEQKAHADKKQSSARSRSRRIGW